MEAQVDTSFLLQPFNKEAASDDEDNAKNKAKRNKKKGRGQNSGSSSEEESDEDFAFLDEDLKENGEMDEISQRLLAGIIQAPPKNLKRFDKLTKEEIWARRKHRGEIISGSIDDDDLDDDELGTIGQGNDTIEHGVSGAKMRRRAR